MANQRSGLTLTLLFCRKKFDVGWDNRNGTRAKSSSSRRSSSNNYDDNKNDDKAS